MIQAARLAFGFAGIFDEDEAERIKDANQPPSGGCELKRAKRGRRHQRAGQPPSGGCELKRLAGFLCQSIQVPAAFGRL